MDEEEKKRQTYREREKLFKKLNLKRVKKKIDVSNLYIDLNYFKKSIAYKVLLIEDIIFELKISQKKNFFKL